jgi:hypothetical protein
VDGKATEAALAAVAGSFGVRRSAARLVSGASSRTKVIDVNAGDPRVLAALPAAPGRLRRGKMLQPFGRRLRAAAQPGWQARSRRPRMTSPTPPI